MIMEASYTLPKGKEEGMPLQGYSWFVLNGVPFPRPSREGLILHFSRAILLKRTVSSHFSGSDLPLVKKAFRGTENCSLFLLFTQILLFLLKTIF
jgi:hypothetical protein